QQGRGPLILVTAPLVVSRPNGRWTGQANWPGFLSSIGADGAELPVELLTQILSELDQTSLGRCAQLSRRWRQIVAQPWLWRRIRIRANPSVNPNLIARLTAWLSASLLELRADRLIALELAPLLSKSKNLQKFTLGEAAERSGPRGQGPAAWAEPAVRSGPLLPPALPAQSAAALLRLAVYRGPAGQAAAGRLSEPGRAGLPRVFELFNREREPRVAAGGHHRPADFAAPGGEPSAVRQVVSVLPECPSLSSVTLSPIFLLEFRQLLSRLSRLAELALPHSNINNSMAELLIHPLHGGGIRGLRLDFCTQLTADRFGRLAAACPRLRSLCIGECRVLDGAAYRCWLTACPPVWRSCGSSGSRAAAWPMRTWPRRCRRSPAAVPAHLPAAGAGGLRWPGAVRGPAACQGLTHLTLDVCHDDRLPALLVQLPRLRCLRLLDCRRLTGRAWANLRTLRVLLYPEADREPYKSEPSLTDEAIADLCASPVARGLRRLWLSGCTQLTPAALASIRNGCPWLQQLVIAGCDDLTEAAVAAFQSAYEQPVLVASAAMRKS
uniref:F-box domain-containing protein n=1 Tax=Macrostomum lignano TaxID=282301 RepID=A0A1I8F1N1_9PLAT